MKKTLSLTEKATLNELPRCQKEFDELFENGDDWIKLKDPIIKFKNNGTIFLKLLKDKYPDDVFEFYLSEYHSSGTIHLKKKKEKKNSFWKKKEKVVQGPLYTKVENRKMERARFYVNKITKEQEDNIRKYRPFLIIEEDIDTCSVLKCLKEKYPNDNFDYDKIYHQCIFEFYLK